ncbi:hypothetical protein MRB53_000202 [Persea americana]|uniref:Uncharacterized protein n=1 Tax=Persea americana TaxID=3435 RepID=A0ACC2MNG2_PERAE|nr:hypothetical protein MRB53_000202 [Persea americana]
MSGQRAFGLFRRENVLCHRMKLLNRVSPEVLIKMSGSGYPANYTCLCKSADDTENSSRLLPSEHSTSSSSSPIGISGLYHQ